MINKIEEYFREITSITNSLMPSDVFNFKELEDLRENILLLIDTYINEDILKISEYNFDSNLFQEIYSIFYIQYDEFINDIKFDNELKYNINDCISFYFKTIIPKRSYPNTFIRHNNPSKSNLTGKINYLKNIPQPEQRTKQWYEFRYNMLTASNAWKGLDTESNINSLIYEKCQPLNIDKYNHINTNTPFHHGTIYEPISIAIYENRYNTKIEDFGCIADNDNYFLGASPDGINVDINSNRYARMLEVKNIVNREITGIPKKEYWIQMQIQMGVCKLNECDFLETKFVEYEDKESFEIDGTFNYSQDNKKKGIFIYFIKNNKPHYEYPPIGLSEKEFIEWEEEIMKKNSDLTWNKNIYWKLEEYSCVLVLRNKLWFETAVLKLQDIWKIIEKERVSGYLHRAPKSSKKKQKNNEIIKPFTGCLININHDNNVSHVNHDNNVSHVNHDNNVNHVIKIDTEPYVK